MFVLVDRSLVASSEEVVIPTVCYSFCWGSREAAFSPPAMLA
jgi:hypothetical protein